ncbi:MAG: hypothetical protein A3H97_25020 [Acidobacteria bacterium RIFCSPLOWO2_02_FULL_65_29]|nr:MAG: hypothetical protein A3H97_25020 [Acidobacteria bacterium RIFCSPLOWO2_02_FULL_65_29]
MPSPVGHALAGVAVALAGNRQPTPFSFRRFLRQPLTLWAVALAALPDADLLLPGFHRSVTHSVFTTLAITILAIAVTGKVTRAGLGARDSDVGWRIAWGVVLMCAAAHASHIVLDWLGADQSRPAGIRALWPWSDRWYISGWDVFPRTERYRMFSGASIAINLRTLAWELLLMGPIVAALSWWRVRQEKPRTPQGHEANNP